MEHHEILHRFDESDPRQKIQKAEIELTWEMKEADTEIERLCHAETVMMLIRTQRRELADAIQILKLDSYDEKMRTFEEARKKQEELKRQVQQNELDKSALIARDTLAIEGWLAEIFTADELRELSQGIQILKDLHGQEKEIASKLNDPERRQYLDRIRDFAELEEIILCSLYEFPLHKSPEEFIEYKRAWFTRRFYADEPGSPSRQFLPHISLLPFLNVPEALQIMTIGISQKKPFNQQAVSQRRLNLLAFVEQGIAKAVSYLTLFLKESLYIGDFPGREPIVLNVLYENLDIPEQQRVFRRELERSLESWRLLREYLVHHLIPAQQAFEEKEKKTTEEIFTENDKFSEQQRDIARRLHGDYETLFYTLKSPPAFDLREWIVRHHEKFSKLLEHCVKTFAPRSFGGHEPIGFHIADNLFHRRYEQEGGTKRDETIIATEYGVRLNPKIFHEAIPHEKALFRLVESLCHSQRSYPCTLVYGEGNVLESHSLAEALAQKMWLADRKWRSLSQDNQKHWRVGEWGSCGYRGESAYEINLMGEDGGGPLC